MICKILGAAALYPFVAAVCSFASVDAGLLALVPANAEIVAGVNVAASRDSDFGRYLAEKFKTDARGFEQLTAETGFDPRRDLQSLVFAATPTAGGKNGPNLLILGRGTLDQQKIRSAALAKGSLIRSFQGVDIYLPHGVRPENAFAFLDVDVFLAGRPATLQSVIANRATASSLNHRLQQLVFQAGSENEVWFASSVSPSHFGHGLNSDVERSMGGGPQALQSITESSGGLRFGSAVQITLDATTRSEKDASALADVVRFAASMVQMKGQSDPRAGLLAGALSQVMVSVAGPSVHFLLSVPESSLEQIAEAHPKQQHASH